VSTASKQDMPQVFLVSRLIFIAAWQEHQAQHDIQFDFKQSGVLFSVWIAFLLVPGGLYRLEILFLTKPT